MSKKVKRRNKTRKLNSIAIPTRKDVKHIEPDLWYIIYEENLTKPKVLRYNFIDEYHARKFVDEYLQGYKYNILQGETLFHFEIYQVDARLSQVAPIKKGSEYRYMFDPTLPSQTRKSLRTAYRRSFRRRLQKLLKRKKTMNKVPVTFEQIKEKPVIFFKRLKKFYRDELTYSVIFREWYINEESWRIDEIKEYAKDIPATVTDVVNIVRALEAKYSDNDYDYKNDTYVSTAIKIHKAYKERIAKYMKKKFGIGKEVQPTHTKVEAWRELIARGFIDNSLLKEPMNPKKDVYIRGNVGNLVWDHRFESQMKAYPILEGYGVKGFTGINIFEK